MTTATKPNITESKIKALNVTHILVVCPRGFVNERSVYAIPADMADQAEIWARTYNPTGDVRYTSCDPWENALQCDKRDAGRAMAGMSVEDYREMLEMMMFDEFAA